MISEEKTASKEDHERTIAACAWLIDIAQHSVDNHGLPSVVVRWLDAMGSGAYVAMDGGMGGMPPMVADVELVAFPVDYRGRFRSQILTVAACHEKQIDSAGGVLQ